MDSTIPQQTRAQIQSNALPQEKHDENHQTAPNAPPICENNAQFDSQFLDIDPEMMKKLQQIEQSNQKSKDNKAKSNKSISFIPKILSPEQQRLQEEAIKKEFVHKLKQWDKEREELRIKKLEIEQKKSKHKLEESLRKKQQQQQEKQFLRLQKQKQIQQKIQQIQQRRQKREESLKNALLKRSYNQLPSYTEAKQKYRQQEQEIIEINIRLLKDKKKLTVIDSEQLKLHEKAYIQRIKERLNMVPKTPNRQKAKSDFNVYLKRSSQKKKEQISKIIKMKMYQEKINKVPIIVDKHKRQEKLIQIDKIKNPHKYRLLSQRPEKTKSVQFLPSESYKQSIELNKQKDNRYLRALQQKLAQAIDM